MVMNNEVTLQNIRRFPLSRKIATIIKAVPPECD